jgi:transcription elongation factor Elf1
MNILQLYQWKNNNDQCPFCQSSNIQEYDAGLDGVGFGCCMECKDCGEEWEEKFETVLPTDFLCPVCGSHEVIDGISIITDIGFVSTYSCDDCDYYWEIEFVLVGITHNNTLYKLENVKDILEEIDA